MGKEIIFKNNDFTMLDNDIIRNINKYSKNELLAYMALSYFADKDNNCNPSYESIAKIMRTSRTTAIQAIQGLVEKGIIVLTNRKEKGKKEMASNDYTIIKKPYWEETKETNRKYIVEKKIEYTKRNNKGKITKEINKDKKNTSDLKNTNHESDAHVKNLNVNYIIPQKDTNENIDFTTKSDKKEEISKTAQMLKDSGVKYVPFKKEKELVDTLDETVLKQAIDRALVSKREKATWYDVLKEYDKVTLEQIRMNREIKNRRIQQIYGSFNDTPNIYTQSNQTKSIAELELEELRYGSVRY